MGAIADRFAQVRERAEFAYRSASRGGGEPRIVCVTKMQSLPNILEAINAGAAEIGENYLQEAVRKGVFALRQSHRVTIRYIGRLQSNKYNAILRNFDAVDSGDQKFLEHIHAVGGVRTDQARTFLLEVNTGEEVQKGGLTIAQIRELATGHSPWLQEIAGLMAVVPLQASTEMRSRMYENVHVLFEDLAEELGPSRVTTLSMGTSDDFEVAIEHGSNMIRVGTAIFGPRLPQQA
ncbi:MAG: YggS family pyridoxal phosphate-dependent enzyme [Candidatus Cryosericum sp.]|nr:YggS family pyridoxal phosphate-dependent enzyme [bacterium]